MIVRDEEANLDACLRSAAALCDEIVVVDTGSTDRTVEIARAHGARVFRFQWCDDFAAARNFALDQTRGQWVLHLDADEVAVESAQGALRAELAAQPPAVNFLRVPVRCHWPGRLGRDEYPARRLFRRRPQVRWRRRIHENITNLAGESRQQEAASAALAVDHFGYVDVAARQDLGKTHRNIRLLTREILENPTDGALHYYLAREHAELGEHERAIQVCRNLLRGADDRSDPEFRWAILCQLMRSAAALGQHGLAVEVGGPAAAGCGSSELLYLLGCARLELDEIELAEEALRGALALGTRATAFQVVEGTGTWRPWLGLGNAAWRAGDQEEAVRRWRTATAVAPEAPAVHLALGLGLLGIGRPDEAVGPLERALALEPELHPARHHLSEAFTQLGRDQDAYDRLEELVRAFPDAPEHWRWLGSLLVQLEELPAAIDVLGRAIERHQSDPQIYILLGTALQRLQRHEDALNAFALAAALDPASEVARAGVAVAAFGLTQASSAEPR